MLGSRYEKMISGMYIGELVRLALLKRANSNLIFSGNVPDVLYQDNSLDGAVVSNCIRLVGPFISLLQRCIVELVLA